MSDNETDSAITAGEDGADTAMAVRDKNKGSPDSWFDETTTAGEDEEDQPQTISRNPTKAVDEETSIGETPGRTSRIVGG